MSQAVTAPAQPTRNPLRVLPVLAPALLAQLIGLTHLTLRPLWLDELITVSRIENGSGRLLADTWDLPVLPYYLLVYVWTLGGT